ncbi:hypothetical protein ScPMuIL_008501 [Solemya velum]
MARTKQTARQSTNVSQPAAVEGGATGGGAGGATAGGAGAPPPTDLSATALNAPVPKPFRFTPSKGKKKKAGKGGLSTMMFQEAHEDVLDLQSNLSNFDHQPNLMDLAKEENEALSFGADLSLQTENIPSPFQPQPQQQQQQQKVPPSKSGISKISNVAPRSQLASKSDTASKVSKTATKLPVLPSLETEERKRSRLRRELSMSHLKAADVKEDSCCQLRIDSQMMSWMTPMLIQFFDPESDSATEHQNSHHKKGKRDGLMMKNCCLRAFSRDYTG